MRVSLSIAIGLSILALGCASSETGACLRPGTQLCEAGANHDAVGLTVLVVRANEDSADSSRPSTEPAISTTVEQVLASAPNDRIMVGDTIELRLAGRQGEAYLVVFGEPVEFDPDFYVQPPSTVYLYESNLGRLSPDESRILLGYGPNEGSASVAFDDALNIILSGGFADFDDCEEELDRVVTIDRETRCNDTE